MVQMCTTSRWASRTGQTFHWQQGTTHIDVYNSVITNWHFVVPMQPDERRQTDWWRVNRDRGGAFNLPTHQTSTWWDWRKPYTLSSDLNLNTSLKYWQHSNLKTGGKRDNWDRKGEHIYRGASAVQQSLGAQGVTFLRSPTDGRSMMHKIKTSWVNGSRGTKRCMKHDNMYN
jgi:hypothetical protein